MNLEHLAYLFAERGDFARADKYAEAIQDEARKWDTNRMLTHIDGYFEYAARDADITVLFKAD
jgi:hypothetical protein